MTESEVEPTDQEVHDPVCHMDIPASQSAGSAEHDGRTYFFCSQECLERFKREPEAILTAEKEHG